MRISFMSPFFPLVPFAVMMGMLMVIILDRVPVMIVKGKGDRCWFHVRAMSTPVIMDNASLKNETHQKQEQH
jgi:hypothetical protein